VLLLLALAACGSPGAGKGAGGGGSETGGSGGTGGAAEKRDAAAVTGGSRADAGRDLGVRPSDASAGGSPDRPTDVEDCTPFAEALCARLAACSQQWLVWVYGDLAGCQERQRLACRIEAVLPGTGLAGAGLAACRAAIPAASCDELLSGTIPACQREGALPDGAACGSHTQCQTGFCRMPETSFCGKCAPRAAEGAACDTSASCQFPLRCSEAGRCVKGAAEGELCNESTPCRPGTLFCSQDNTCKRPSAEGKACNRIGNSIAQPCETGLSCRPAERGTCRAIRFVGAGEACGVIANAAPVLCRASGSCVQNSCRPAGKDGEACTISPLGDSGGCLAPALCLEGRCKLPDPASCM
jgi:hypothetical protein